MEAINAELPGVVAAGDWSASLIEEISACVGYCLDRSCGCQLARYAIDDRIQQAALRRSDNWSTGCLCLDRNNSEVLDRREDQKVCRRYRLAYFQVGGGNDEVDFGPARARNVSKARFVRPLAHDLDRKTEPRSHLNCDVMTLVPDEPPACDQSRSSTLRRRLKELSGYWRVNHS
jgi:hypothetical protein